MDKRFESGEGDKGLLIYDNTGVDDYYFINDPEERTKFITLINNIEDEWKEKYNHVLGKYKKQLDLNNEKNREITQLKKENAQLIEAIIGKIQYNEDLEKFAVEQGIISKDGAKFDYYD